MTKLNSYTPALSAVILLAVYAYSKEISRTQFVTMTKSELIEIVDCISQSKNQGLCFRFQICNKMMPEQVNKALDKCEKKINVHGKGKCNENEQLYPSTDIISKVFECVSNSTTKLSAEESKKMMEFETCARNLYVGSCKLVAKKGKVANK